MSFSLVVPRLTLIGLAVVVAVVLIGGVAYIYLPQAVITVFPRETQQPTTQDIMLSSKVTSPDFVHFTLPTRVVEKTIEESQEFTRSGTTTEESFARGDVVFTNEQDEEQALLPKTNLRHEATGVGFLTNDAVRIPPKGTLRVGITAKEKGTRGEVQPGKFIVEKLPEALQALVFAMSTQPTSGGLAVDSPLTEKELKDAQTAVHTKAEERLMGELTAEAKGATIRRDLIKIEPEEEKASADVGSTAYTFRATSRLRGRAFVVDENDLLSLSVLALRSTKNPEQEFVSYEPASFSVTLNRLDFERGEARITTTVTGKYAAKIGPTIFDTAKLAGRTPAEVEDYFHQFPSVGKVEVKLSPFWVKSVPARTSAVKIAVGSEKR